MMMNNNVIQNSDKNIIIIMGHTSVHHGAHACLNCVPPGAAASCQCILPTTLPLESSQIGP